MTVFVTGASGFIGSHLVKTLRAAGTTVATLTRVWSHASVRNELKASAADVVVHLATHYRFEHQPDDVSKMLVANVELTTMLCEAMRRGQVTRLVTIGSAFQDFNGRPGVPANLYAATKSAADAIVDYYVDAHEFRVVNLRLANVYGPDDTRENLFTRIHDGMDMTSGEQQTAFVHVDDVVATIQKAMAITDTMAKSQLLHFCAWGQTNSLRALVTEMYPTLTLQWGAVPYRPREMMQLPTHLPTLLPQGVLT